MGQSSDQKIIVVDEDGSPTGEYIPKEVGHTGEGRRHLAITVLLYNKSGEVLLQKRKHQVFDNIWDFTGATHPLHLEDGQDETLEQATRRCLKREYQIGEIELKNLGFFNYFAKYSQNLCENEHCAMLIGEYNGEFELNPEVGYECKWIEKKLFLKDIEQNPQNYSPWAIEGVRVLKKSGFFNSPLSSSFDEEQIRQYLNNSL
ncbi:NUDIX domain-containing protein [Candidatus Daviesbacteria bacterium]|nr:NUDIX domain-containing protein [Candidatus Daviesbacteria bacterium]